MKEKDFRIIENKLDDVILRLKGQTELTEEQINRLDKKTTEIVRTIIGFIKKETDTKDNWKGTGFFVNTTDDYK